MIDVTPEILARFFEGKSTLEENNTIADWIEMDPGNQQIFNKELQVYMMIMHDHASDDVPLRNVSAGSRRIKLARYAAIAASFLVGVLLSWFLGVAPIHNEASKMLTFHTDPGQRATLTLPDGTSVEMNSGSTLEYPAIFARGERRVRINGEAMFDVVSDSGKPFYVETFAYDVKVQGTRFNVEAYEDSGVFNTALMEGSIAVIDKNENVMIELEPNEVVTLSDEGLVKKYMRDIMFHYRWTDGIINCEGLSFIELMRKFESSFGVNIIVECDNVPDICYKRMKVNIRDGIAHAFALLQRSTEFTLEYDEYTNTYYVK
jgi:ferric-dicitrate binding protein FerR (iron transport regulator)